MKRKILIILIIILVVVSSAGCIKPEESPIYNKSDGDSFGLTMSVYLFTPDHMIDAAKLYEVKTGIKVNIQNNFVEPDFDSNDPYYDIGKYTEQAMTELMAGRGADIYDLRWLDFELLGKNGLLVDMSDWLDNDAEFTNENVFRNIMLSAKTDSGVFAVYTNFFLRKLYVASEEEPLLPNKQMTWQEFFDEVSGLEYTQDRAYFDHELNIFMERFISKASQFIDETGKTQSLYSEDMILLLEECKQWRDMGLCAEFRDQTRKHSDSYLFRIYGINDQMIAEALCTLPERYRSSVNYVAPIPFDGDPVVTDGDYRYPQLNENGMARYGVNAGSNGTKAAQDLLRFLLSEEGQKIMLNDESYNHNGFWIPVNRAAFRSIVERDLDRVQASFSQLELDFPGLINEAEEYVDQIAYFVIEKPYYRSIIREVAKDFFLDEITAEEAAQQMSDKVGLYLKELG